MKTTPETKSASSPPSTSFCLTFFLFKTARQTNLNPLYVICRWWFQSDASILEMYFCVVHFSVVLKIVCFVSLFDVYENRKNIGEHVQFVRRAIFSHARFVGFCMEWA